MDKAIALGIVMKVSVGNVNASHTEGNISVTKKVTLPDGNTIPYISGQAMRRMMRDGLEDLGWILGETEYDVTGQEVTPKGEPAKYIDEDLFGFMDPSGSRKRTSPVRVSPAIGLFPFRGDRDLGTRSFERFGKTMGEGGNMFETEVYYNLFRSALLIELDRIGVFGTLETGNEDIQEIKPQEKLERVKGLLEALKHLWGGGKTARLLTDLSPKFFAYARLGIKHPLFLENIDVKYEDNKLYLDEEKLITSVEKVKNYDKCILFGIEKGFFTNEVEIEKKLGKYGKIYGISDAIDKAKEDVSEVWKS